MRPTPLCIVFLGALGASLALGCGYRVVGHGAGGARALWIEPVPDETDEPLFGPTLAAELSRQAVDRGDVVVARRGEAGAHLTVRLERLAEGGAAYVAGDLVREYVITGEVTATLASAEGAVLWRGSGIRADREFPAGRSINETEANKDRALELLARDLAREVLRRVSLAGLAP